MLQLAKTGADKTVFQKLVLPLILAAVILAGVRSVVQPFTITTQSMAPSLKEGDRVIIESLYKYREQAPQRFDLLAVIPPYVEGKAYKPKTDLTTKAANLLGLPGMKPEPLYIRRVIAVPGEQVEVRKDIGVLIDGRLLEEAAFTTGKPSTSTEVITVPQGHYFVLPDHRNTYAGSDLWGPVGEDRIIGKLSYRWGYFHIDPIEHPLVVYAAEKVEFNDRGVKALEENKFQEAIALFNKALKIDRDYDVARDNLSIAYNNYAIHLRIKPEAAIDKLHKALYIDPDNELTRKNLNKLLKESGVDAEDGKKRADLGERAFKEGRLLDALVEFREAARLMEDNAVSARIEQLQGKDLFPEK